MAVALDSTGNTIQVASTTTMTSTLTIPANSDRLMMAVLSFNSSISGLSVTWDSGGSAQACTQVGLNKTATFNFWNYLFKKTNPTAGASLSLTASWTGAFNASMQGLAFSGVHQVTPHSSVSTNTGNSTQVSVTAVVGSGEYALMGAFVDTATLSSGSHTELGTSTLNQHHTIVQGSTTTGSPITFTAASSIARNWGAIAVTILPSAAATGSYRPTTRRMLGIGR